MWLKLPEPEKTFLQGLIQVTAAFHHLQCDNRLGTTLLLQAALGRLDRYPEFFGGISVALLRSDIRERLRMLGGFLVPSQQPAADQRHGFDQHIADDGDLDDAGEHAAGIGKA